jgi:hypothetical protein
MRIHKYTQLEDLNNFLDSFDDDSNLFVRIIFNKKNEEVYYVIEKDSRKHQRFEKGFNPSERFGPTKY